MTSTATEVGARPSVSTSALRLIGADAARWARVDGDKLWSATALAVVASALMALNRFGGLATSAPRSFVRLTLVGVWGWLLLALAIWALGLALSNRGVPRRAGRSLRRSVVVVGLAHLPIAVLAVVLFVFAGMFQLLGPGYVTAVFAFSVWMPLLLVTGARYRLETSWPVALVSALAPYLGWWWLAGSHLVGRVEHLL